MEFALIGKTLKHSFSKEIHNKIADYNYELIEINPSNLKNFIIKKNYKGLNVTIPYKQDIVSMLDFVTDSVKSIGAANTIVNKDGFLYGYNTDFFGLIALINKYNFKFKNSNILILGSGGTSKTAYYVSYYLGAKNVWRASRRPKTIKDNLAKETISYNDAIINYKNLDYIINTTPVGMYPDINSKPIDITKFTCLKGVLDVVYNPLQTKFVIDAKINNIRSCGGLYMCVAQAVYSAELFLNKKFNKSKIDLIYDKIKSDIIKNAMEY